jgi:hypothetical protein
MNSIVQGQGRVSASDTAEAPHRHHRTCGSRNGEPWPRGPSLVDQGWCLPTREWAGDVRAGGQWRASGVAFNHMNSRRDSSRSIHAPQKARAYGGIALGHEPPTTFVTSAARRQERLALRHAGLLRPPNVHQHGYRLKRVSSAWQCLARNCRRVALVGSIGDRWAGCCCAVTYIGLEGMWALPMLADSIS